MATLVCYIVTGIDGTIAKWFGWTPEQGKKGMNPAKVASLRGLYDQQAEEQGTEPLLPMDNPTDEDLEKAAKTLMQFRAGIREYHRAKMAKGVKHIDRAYDALRHAYSLHQRQSRISLISNLFSEEVDRLMAGGKADRQSYVNGFTAINGERVGGEFSILEGVYNQILELRANYYRASEYPETYFKNLSQATKDAESRGEIGPLSFAGAPQTVEEYREMAKHRYEEYTKVLENWNELVPFVLKDLVKKEGVKLGIKKEYTSTASSDSFGDNDIAAKWEMSESVRDGWQRNNDLESAFGSVGQQVRRILATVPMVEQTPQYKTGTDLDGRPYRKYTGMKFIPVKDDLGNQQFMDPVKTHQELQEFLKGMQSSEDMLYRMCKKGKPGVARIPWMQPIVDVLVSNPQARTQFFVDFKRNFQPYSIMFDDKKEGNGFIRKIKTRVLNKAKNYLKGKYDIIISSKGKLPANSKVWLGDNQTVFDENTKEVNWERLAELRKKVLMWTKETINDVEDEDEGFNLANWKVSLLIDKGRDTTITIDGEPKRLTYEMKRNFLMEVFSSLGYDVTVDTIDSILQSRDIYTVREQLEQLFDPKGNSGFLYAAEVKSLGPENLKKLQKTPKSFRTLYNTRKLLEGGREIYPVKEHSEKLLDIISKHQEGYRVESRVRYNGNTMYSFVNPSYLGDRLETIQSYVENDNKLGLLAFLRNEYLNSPFFVDDEYLATNGTSGRILNMWLSDLVSACKDKKKPLMESVASIFNYERDLGREDKEFENFTAKEHGLDMFIHFFADEQQHKGYGGKGGRDSRKKLSAMYPVFILGDAGVSKYIRAPRISSAVPLDKSGNALSLADIGKTVKVEYRFDQEAQNRVVNAFYDIYIQERRRMAMDEAMAYKMYANGKEVKHPKGEFSILTFLNDENYAIPSGKEYDDITIKAIIRQYLEDSAIGSDALKSQGRKSFKQRMEDLGILETVDTKKGKVYRNISSIATPDNIDDKIREFYWNTKLATAQQLQLMTIDPSFYHGTKDLQKRYKEIHAPGTILDTKARNMFATPNADGTYPLFSEDGIERVVYFDDIRVDTETTNKEFWDVLSKIFKDQPEVLEEYKKCTLTDGQGYRSLSSYRKVMGMAGKWTREMEETYNTIQEIRQRHLADDSDITPEEFQQITRLAQVFQPIKPYMFTHEKYPIKINKKDDNGNDVMGTDGKPVQIDTFQYIPVQHKYAEALIIPELMPKGSKLRDLANWMEDHNVDMVGSTKIGKVGVFGQAKIDTAADKASLNSAMSSAYVHELPYSDYRIQTNVPEHINSSQLFGTQVRKLIMAGLDFKGLYDSYLMGIEGFNGTVNLSTDDEHNKECKLNGRNLLALYNSLICANIMDSYVRFAQNADNIESLSSLLQQSTVGSMREAMDNLFSYVVTGNEEGLKKFLIPLFEGGLEHDAAALILSTFKKIVNKQQISGGSAVQVSAFGIDGYEEDGGLRYVVDPDNDANVLYAEIEMPFDKSIMIDVRDANGNVTKQPVSLPYDRYVRQDGYMIPTGEAIEKTLPNGKTNPIWKKYQSYTYKEVNGQLVPCKYDDPDAKVYKPLIEEDYPDILSILAYRIPTERDYSMINCQIKRFTSKTAGGTLKCPPQGTTIAGFDFDIDKLYFMLREYHKHYNDKDYVENNFSERDKLEVWTAFYEANPEIKEALEAARAEAESKDLSLVEYVPIIRRGVDTGRTRLHHKTTLNSYWEPADIESRFGKIKGVAFAETAQAEGIKPTQNVSTNTTEWMESYDFSKSPEDNTRAARNNLLISLIQARLMDPQTAKQRYTPGGFANASKAARLMRELFHGDLTGIYEGGRVDLVALEQRQDDDTDPEPNYDPTDPYTMLVYNQQNQVAAKLIGIFANQNTNHAFASSMDVFELLEPISFCGKSGKDLLYKPSPTASQEEKDRLAGKRAEIDLNMAEFLAASVDAVKDPVLNFLNLNTLTADAGALLARLGYNTKEIGLLFNQPVIRKVCEDAFNRGVNISTAIKDAADGLMTNMTGYSPNEKIPISEQDLARGIVVERKMLEEGKSQDDFLAANARMQMQVLQLFDQVIKTAQDISDFVMNTKFTASNAVSSTFGGMYAQQLRVNEYVDKFPKGEKDEGSLSYKVIVAQGTQETGLFSMPIDNNENYIGMTKKQYLHMVRFNPFAYEQAMYDANRKAIKLLSKYFPYERPLYRGIRDKMAGLAMYGTLSEDDINDIHSNIPVALLAKQAKSLFNGEAAHEGTNLTHREYYREKFASDLADKIAADPDGLGSLAIFKYLYPSYEEVPGEINPNTGLSSAPKEVWRISMQDIGGMDADTKEEIRESWAYLMEVKDDGHFDSVEMAELGRDLFMYCYYQLGFDFSPISFMHLAPTAVKDNIPVPRNESLTPKHWNQKEGIKPNSDDVYVWFPSMVGGAEKASDDFDANLGYADELSGNSFQLSDMKPNNFRKLIEEATSHPELKFKLAMDLTQAEFDELAGAGDDIPSNIYFSPATRAQVSEGKTLSYGGKRSYRQFLNEILDGTEQGLNQDEFAQMWILNHLDNARFVFDTAKGGERLKEILFGSKDGKTKGIVAEAGGQMNGMKYRDVLPLDISKFMNDQDKSALSKLVRIKEVDGKIIDVTWAPCIVINGVYYLAESGTDLGFNVIPGPAGLRMNYRKVEPWGASKTIEYEGNKKLTPQMRYQISMSAEPQRNKIPVDDEPIESMAPTVGSNSSQYNAAVHNALEAVKPQGADWSAVEEAVLNIDGIFRLSVWPKLASVVPNWRNITEQQRRAIANALTEYNKVPELRASSSTDGNVSPESLIERGNGNANGIGTFVRAYEQQIFDEFVAARNASALGPMSEQEKQEMANQLRGASDEDLDIMVSNIRYACRKNGVLMLDADGNLLQGC